MQRSEVEEQKKEAGNAHPVKEEKRRRVEDSRKPVEKSESRENC